MVFLHCESKKNILSHLTHTDKKVYPVGKKPVIAKPSFWKKVSSWENYPKNIFLLPLYFYGIWKAITNRTMWLFSTSNPGMTFGSFFGLTKSEVYSVLPENTYPNTILISSSDAFSNVLEKIKNSNLEYPFIAKPDVGMVGLLVRVIKTEEQLKAYHQLVKCDWIAQAFVPYEVEVGLFYVRHPENEKGKIIGLSEKKPLSVIGDGYSKLGDLVKNDVRASNWEEEVFRKHKKRWNEVPAEGEFVQLMYTGNRKNGARLIELVDQVDEDLVAIFDKISHHKGQIFYGRYDIKCNSLEELKQGKNFSILEFNGVHSGYGHLYHCGKSAKEAYKTIFQYWKELYDICIANHKRGAKFTPFFEGWKLLYRTIRHFIKLSKWEKRLP